MTQRKIVSPSSESINGLGGTLVFGHFNLIHPGHRRFLNHAKSEGSPLVVAVQGESALNPEDRDRFYPEHERAEGVAALDIVDLVLPLGESSFSAVVERVQPDVLLLGDEFETSPYPSITAAIQRQRELGGEVQFHAGQSRQATSDFLDFSSEDLEQVRFQQFRASCGRRGITRSKLSDIVGNMANASVLVIGDTILDRYVACDPLGMSAEAPVIVVRELADREYVGGAAVVASNIRALGAQVHYVSVVGDDQPGAFAAEHLRSLGISTYLVRDTSRPTTYKTRYMVENQKLFRVSRLQDHDIDTSIEDRVVKAIQGVAHVVNAIVVSDFVYGVITPRILEAIREVQQSRSILTLADLQCSSQIGNVGKFKDMSVLCPTEREARVALGLRSEGIEWVAMNLMRATTSKNLVLKLGQDGFVSYESISEGVIGREHFPALSTSPLDVTGAGDALLATLASALGAGASFMESSALGAVVASLAVGTVGNQPVDVQAIDRLLTRIGLEESRCREFL